MMEKHSGQFEITTSVKLLPGGSFVTESVAIVDGVEYKQRDETESMEASLFGCREDVCFVAVNRNFNELMNQIKASRVALPSAT